MSGDAVSAIPAVRESLLSPRQSRRGDAAIGFTQA